MATFNISPLGQHVRDRHRPRHGLPRQQPGHARLRAHDPVARARAHPGHRRDAAIRRDLLPPVPAADQEGQRRDRRRFLRRPPVADPVDLRSTSRRRATSASWQAPCGYARQARTAKTETCCTTWKLSIAYTMTQARPARAAADRPRRLERLPEPQLLLDGAQRELPVRGRREGQQRRERDDRGPVPVREPRDGRAVRFHGQGRATRPHARAATTRCSKSSRRKLGRRMVPPRLRRRRQAGGLARRTTKARSSSRARAGACSAGPGREQRPRARRKAMESVHKHLFTKNGVGPAAAAVLDVPRRARRSDQLSARGEGKRRHLLPQQHLDQSRLVPAGRRRPGPRVLPVDLPIAPRKTRSKSTAASPTSTPR